MDDKPKCGACGTPLADPIAGCDTCNPENREAARQRMLSVLPHFRYAVRDAASKGKVEIGILAVAPDGGGHVVCRFDAEDFFKDLAHVLCAGPQTADDEMSAKAQQIVDIFGGSRRARPGV